MKEYHCHNCKIGKVKLKSGGELRVIPKSRNNFRRMTYDWGEVTVRYFDDDKITNSDCVYILEAAKYDFMRGNGE